MIGGKNKNKKPKLDNEYKEDVSRAFQEADYVGKKLGIRFVAYFLCVTVLSGIIYGGTKYFQTEWDREVFKQSTAYNEGATSFLAKTYKEYNEAESSDEQKSLMEYVIMRYPNLDTDHIENDELRKFYNKCMGGV